MKQYCRYCAFCFEGDVFYCSVKEIVLSENKIKRANKCKEFAFINTDVISGKEYKPHTMHTISELAKNQIKFNFTISGDGEGVLNERR